jgi:hypothetical protein
MGPIGHAATSPFPNGGLQIAACTSKLLRKVIAGAS